MRQTWEWIMIFGKIKFTMRADLQQKQRDENTVSTKADKKACHNCLNLEDCPYMRLMVNVLTG
jgi:hypothetical protein